MNPTPRPIRSEISRAATTLICALILSACVPAARAQAPSPFPEHPEHLELGHIPPNVGPLATPLPFDSKDFIYLTADRPVTRIFWGEPWELTLRLANMTKFPITIETSFHPRGKLDVTIQEVGEGGGRRRDYHGPYIPGQYTDDQIYVYPREERRTRVIIWGDMESENGLAFPRPGRYRVTVRLKEVTAKLSTVRRHLDIVDGAQPRFPVMAPFQLEVLPPRPSTAPLIDRLIDLGAFPYLHTQNLLYTGARADLKDRLLELVVQYPATTLSPYMDLAIARTTRGQAGADIEDPAIFNVVNERLQRAALADSFYRDLATLDLIRLYDSRGLATLAKQRSIDLLQNLDPDLAVIMGTNNRLVRKYLINSAAISPIKYWDLLE